MTDAKGQYQKLPPGWDCKYDQATGNCYYINYFTKAMQLEDPRGRYKQLQNERCSTESIAMQPINGSPYHVYPSNNLQAVRAFQAGPGTNTSLHNMSSSPLLSSRGNLELSPLRMQRGSLTQTPRLGNMSRRSTIQETSFTNPIDTDAVVNKIQNMFPTASEDHIRLLLKKYLKTIFPKADEMVLLDILASSDNNVQTASEKLISMGYTKRDFIPPKISHRSDHEAAHAAAAAKRAAEGTTITLQPKIYTAEEKTTIQAHMKEKFPQLAERIILMALESVNYAEDRAIQILYIVQEEDELHAKKNAATAAAATDAVMQSASGPDAEVILGAADSMHGPGGAAAADDSIITVVVKTPLNSYNDDRKSYQSVSTNHNTYAPTSLTSTSLPSPTFSSSAFLSSSLPQSSAACSALKSSTKINATRNIGSKKVAFPSINLTTPTTATTQIILSNSPTCIERDEKETMAPAVVIAAGDVVDSLPKSSTIINPSATPSSTSISPSKALKELHISSELPSSATSTSNLVANEYEKLTTRSMLARCNTYASGIQGYLHGTNSNKAANTSASILDKLKLTRLREKTEPLNAAQQDSTDGASIYKQRQDFKSIIGRITTSGHSADLAKGADESLLLADYVTWNGANPDMPQGNNQKQLAQGPDAGKLSERSYTAIGRNPELCKGAQKGLAKGSIYAQLAAAGNTKTTNIKCN
uniref:CUE domain-containing protein n=2 Tax=Bactrocera latifrons TaxID=174628 RepID=A0A0K8U6Q8_BACLA